MIKLFRKNKPQVNSSIGLKGKRGFHCDSCGKDQIEEEYGKGVDGWSQIMGIRLDTTENPMFCDQCTVIYMDSLDQLFQEYKELRGVG